MIAKPSLLRMYGALGAAAVPGQTAMGSTAGRRQQVYLLASFFQVLGALNILSLTFGVKYAG